MISVLCVGRQGQVAQALSQLPVPDAQIHFLGRPELDITDAKSVGTALDSLQPQLVINASAYTHVNQAESEPESAFAVNALGVGYLAQSCSDRQVPLIHLSTDYVFDGTKLDPYQESDEANPLNVYGQSKRVGEEKILATNAQSLIIRVSWVYSATGTNFVQTMLRLAREGKSLSVINDQYGTPTSAWDIAHMLAMLIAECKQGKRLATPLMHFAAKGYTSWHGFAAETFAQALNLKLIAHLPELNAVSAADYGASLARPANSRLNCARFDSLFAYERPYWQDSLRQVLLQIAEK